MLIATTFTWDGSAKFSSSTQVYCHPNYLHCAFKNNFRSLLHRNTMLISSIFTGLKLYFSWIFYSKEDGYYQWLVVEVVLLIILFNVVESVFDNLAQIYTCWLIYMSWSIIKREETTRSCYLCGHFFLFTISSAIMSTRLLSCACKCRFVFCEL